MLDKKSQTNNDFVLNLLVQIVNKVPNLYETSRLSYNLFNLIHISADAKQHGSPEIIRAFLFGNHLEIIKKSREN